MHDAPCEVSTAKKARSIEVGDYGSVTECDIIWITLQLMIRILGSIPNIFYHRILLVVCWKGSDLQRRCWTPMQYLRFSAMRQQQSKGKPARLKLLWQHPGIWSDNSWQQMNSTAHGIGRHFAQQQQQEVLPSLSVKLAWLSVSSQSLSSLLLQRLSGSNLYDNITLLSATMLLCHILSCIAYINHFAVLMIGNC